MLGDLFAEAAGILAERGILRGKEKLELNETLSKAYRSMVDNAGEFGLDHKNFQSHLDKTLFNKEEFVEEYLGFFDTGKGEEQPDVLRLYEIYKQTVTRDFIPFDNFENAFDYFWGTFLVESKAKATFREKFRDRIINLYDTHVSSQDVKDYIALYCNHVIAGKEDKYNRVLGNEGAERRFWHVAPSLEWIEQSREPQRIPIRSIEKEIMSLNRQKMVYIGNAGVGKSTFLLYLEKEFLKKGRLAVYFHTVELEESATIDFLKKLLITKLDKVFRGAYKGMPEPKMKGLADYLLRYGKIIFIIDAYDQISDEKLNRVNRLINDTMYCCPLIISTRPYSLPELRSALAGLHLAEIKEFTEDQIKEYFGDSFHKAEKIARMAKELIKIPLLAKLVKSLILDGGVEEISSKADLFEQFVTHLKKKQIRNDIDGGIKRDRYEYDEVIGKLSELSLSLLRKGTKQIFHKKDAKEFLRYFTTAEKMQLLVDIGKNVLDIESVKCLKETTHKFHHLNFQEYFAAKQLFEIYEGKNKGGLFRALAGIKYNQEVGGFFSELINKNTLPQEAEGRFNFWQETLCKTENDQVRTYALQVRDMLGEDKAKKAMKQLFKKEEDDIREKVRIADEKLKVQGSSITEDMVTVPVGKFLRGSYEDDDEWPVRWIEIDEFKIDRYPVTNERYCRFLNEKKPDANLWKWINLQGSFMKEKCRIKKDGEKYTIEKEEYKGHPVLFVSWEGAKAYCEWKGEGYRLPKEAEWEKAARGMYGRRYPWGNEFDSSKCRTNESKEKGTANVESYSEGLSLYGCYYMSGNVREWCEDHDKAGFYEGSDAKNPLCKDKHKYKRKALRGGSWLIDREYARCAARDGVTPVARSVDIGFRCARTLK